MTTIDISPEAVEQLAHHDDIGGDALRFAPALRALSAALTQSRAETAAAYERAARICEDRNDEIWDRNTGEKVGLDGAAEKIRALTPADAIAARDRMIADAVGPLMEALRVLIAHTHECERELTETLYHVDFCGESRPLTDARAILAAIPKGGE